MLNSKKKRKNTRKSKTALKKIKLAKSVWEEKKEGKGNSDTRNAHVRAALGEESGDRSANHERSEDESVKGAGNKLSKTTQSSKVIDVNQVLHTFTIDKSFEENEKDISDKQSDSELELDNSDPDQDEPETDQEQEKLVFEVGSSETEEEQEGRTHTLEQSLSEEEMLTQQGQSSSEGEQASEEEESLPRQNRKKMSSLRLKMRQRIRAKKKTGFVGFRNHIPEAEFQLMLQGKLDVWDSAYSGVGLTSNRSSENSSRTHDTGESKIFKCNQPSEDTPMDEAASLIEQHITTDSDSPGEIKDLPFSSEGQKHHLPPSSDVASSTVCSQDTGNLLALILTPTRELAMQVHTHITAVAKYTRIKVRIRGIPSYVYDTFLP